MVRCKVRVTSVTDTSSSYYPDQVQESHIVKMSPVSGPENASWSKYTPGGQIELSINNPEAFSQFKVGEFYFVDFSVAPAKESQEK